MQVFKAFIKVAKRNFSSVSIYLIIYAVVAFLMGTMGQESAASNFETKSLNICVIDEDASKASDAFTKYLSSMHTLVSLENDPEVLQDNLYYRYVNYILTIPDGFEEKLLAGDTSELLTNVKVPGSSAGYFLDQQIDQYLLTLQTYLAGGYTLTEATEQTFDTLKSAEQVTNTSFAKDNKENASVFYFLKFLAYVLILMLLCGLSPLLGIFQEKNLKDRVSCSAVSTTAQTLQLTLGCILYSILIWLVFMALGAVVFGKAMFTQHALFGMLNCFVYLLVAAALTLLISFFAPNYNTTNLIANIIGLSMSFLGGVFVEQSLLSEKVLSIGRFFPTYWYVKNLDMLGGISKDAFDIHFYWKALGIQLLFALAIFAVALATYKVRKQKKA